MLLHRGVEDGSDVLRLHAMPNLVFKQVVGVADMREGASSKVLLLNFFYFVLKFSKESGACRCICNHAATTCKFDLLLHHKALVGLELFAATLCDRLFGFEIAPTIRSFEMNG